MGWLVCPGVAIIFFYDTNRRKRWCMDGVSKVLAFSGNGFYELKFINEVYELQWFSIGLLC